MNKNIDCLIVGLGLIGGSFALSLRKKFPDSKIYGYDLKKKSIDIALKKKIIDEKFNFDRYILQIKLVIIAVPSLTAIEILKKLKKLNIAKDTTIFDLSSSKKIIHDEIKKFSKDFLKNVVLCHPIAGSEKSGINACSFDLFMDKKLILINDVFTSRKSLQFSKMIWQLIGSKVIPMGLNDHEKVFCYLSHLPHLVSFAMVNTVGEKKIKNVSGLAGAGFYDFTRIAASSTEMWLDIFISNKNELIKSINLLQSELDYFKDNLKKNNHYDLKSLINSASSLRRKWKIERK